MNSKIWLINMALLGMVAVFGFRAYAVWSHGVVIPGEDARSKSAVKNAVTPVSVTRKKVPSENVYNLLVSKNLFDPGRQYVEVKTTEEASAIKPGPKMLKKVFLYGVIFASNSWMALVNDPDSKRRGRKDLLWVKVGESLGDFHVTGIEREKIVLEKDGKIYDISLYDKEKPQRRVPVESVVKPKVITVKPKPTERKPTIPKSKTLNKGNKTFIKTPFGTIKRKVE